MNRNKIKFRNILPLLLMYLTMLIVGYICSDCCNPNPDWKVNIPKSKQIHKTTKLNKQSYENSLKNSNKSNTN